MAGIWVGIDDTDSPRGGCTTWLLTELLAVARAHGAELIGPPRLVRLNPNVPWKTRGNAALAMRLGRGEGRARLVGEIGGAPYVRYARGEPLPAAVRASLLDALWERVRSGSERAPGTDPAMVVAPAALPESLYWSAVREVVPVASVRRALNAAGAVVRTRGSSRGLVGAAAAIAWPARRATWEVIAYRERSRWGSSRAVDAASVRRAAARYRSLFLCDDRRTRRLLVAPHTPCPILFGLRATRSEAAIAARAVVRSEPVDRWMLFRTNQGTGDHLVPRSVQDLRPYRSAIVDGSVDAPPRTIRGGHVTFSLRDRSGATVDCVAFEPTKTLPRIVARLAVGDRVVAYGSCGTGPGLRLEGLRIVSVRPRAERQKPRCPRCNRPSRSLGRLRGFACPECERRWPPEAARLRRRPPGLRRGMYHPTPSARRHLARRAPEP